MAKLEVNKYYVEVVDNQAHCIFKVFPNDNKKFEDLVLCAGFALNGNYAGSAIKFYIGVAARDNYIEIDSKTFYKIYHIYSTYQKSLQAVADSINELILLNL